jgi:hypothetical protein
MLAPLNIAMSEMETLDETVNSETEAAKRPAVRLRKV